jgi:hypothetical protein
MHCMMARGIISIVAFDPDNGAVQDNNIIIMIKKIIVFKNPSTTIDTIPSEYNNIKSVCCCRLDIDSYQK